MMIYRKNRVFLTENPAYSRIASILPRVALLKILRLFLGPLKSFLTL